MNSANNRIESNIYLRGVDLVVARGIWGVLVLIALGIFLVAIPFRFQQLITVTSAGDNPLAVLAPVEAEWLTSHGISLTAYAFYFLALEIIFAAVYIILGLVIYWRKSREGLGMFASLALITFGILVPGTARVLDDGTGSLLEGLLHLVQNIGWVSFSVCFFIFPDGHFVPRVTRFILIPFVAWATAWLVSPFANPFNWHLPMMLAGFLFLFSIGFAAQLYRYFFVSTPVQRVQTRWVLYAFGVATVGVGIFLAPGLFIAETREPGSIRVLYHMIGIAVFAIALLSIPISINVAIFRYRLWDIDILIRRTLIYGVLTILLILIYLASIVLMLALLGPIVGELWGNRLAGQASSIVPTIATLAIAALFNPLRRRVQNAIDRRFYRRKYDAQQVLAEFAATVRDETDLEKLAERLLLVVDETMQPTSVSLWLTSPLHSSPSRKADGGEVS